MVAVSGGEPGTVCVKYSTLEESEDIPLVEWQVSPLIIFQLDVADVDRVLS